MLCQMRDIDSTSSGHALTLKQAQIITMPSWNLQTKVVQSKGWLSAMLRNMARINDPWDGSLNKRKVRGLVSCFGHDG